MLADELRSRRLSHAYLLVGPDPERLRAAATLLAQALNCRSPGPEGPCGACGACDEISRGVYPDLTMDGGGAAPKLAEAKARLALLAERPVAGPRRVVVMGDAAEMGRETQNALLKSLEEPAGSSVLILLARTVEGILPTVSSRCRLVPVGPASPAQLRQDLAARWGLEERLARWVMLAAGDDPGLLAALAQREELPGWVTEALRFVSGALGPSPLPPLELVDRHQAQLATPEVAANWLALVGGVLRAAMAGGAGLPGASAGEAELAQVPAQPAARLAELIVGVRQAIARHAGARLALEAALISLSEATWNRATTKGLD